MLVKFLIKNGDLVVGKNTAITANAVLTKFTGGGEICTEIPTRKISDR